jgi:charged multivesicular body protein 7
VLGDQALSPGDAKVLLTHLARDRQAISYSPTTGTIKFKPASSTTLQPITEEDINIASLRTLLASLQPQIDTLTDRSNALDKKAREAVSKKQTIVAKTALVQKKAVEAAIQQRSATLLQLEDVYAKIEQAADQVEIVSVMEAAGKTLKSLNAQTGGVEKVQDVMESLRESMLDADEIGTALNENAANAIDNGEVEDELEAMEKVEREKREAVEKQLNEVREQKERVEREKKEADEVDALSQRLAELDSLGVKTADIPSPKIAQSEGAGKA